MNGDDHQGPPERLRALVERRMPALTAQQRREGWRRVRQRMDGGTSRRRWAVVLASAGAAAAAALLLLPRRQPPSLAAAYEVRGATVRGEEITADERPAEVRFASGGVVSLRRGAALRVTDGGARGAVLVLEGEALVDPRGKARWTVQAGPFRVGVGAGPVELYWSADRAHFTAHARAGTATISGPLAGRGLSLRAGDRLSADLRAYQLRVNGGGGSAAEPGVASRPLAAPAVDLHAAALGAADPVVTVHWDRPTGRAATRLHYGLNLFRAFAPAEVTRADTAVYQSNLAAMRPGLVRLYRGDMLDDAERPGAGWLLEPDRATYRWAVDKIRRALDFAIPPGAVTMLTIPGWPAYMGPADQPLAPEHHEAFAALCADLVRIVNVQLGHGVRYFEVFNERDDAYRGRGEEMGALFTRVARAMKAVDPSIHVGGPGFVQPWHPVIGPFLKAAGPALDFVSYHGYGTGDLPVPLADVLASAAGFGHVAAYIERMVSRHVGRPVEIFHNQYNVTWKAPDDRMTGGVSAVFDALALAALAQSPLTGAAAWCESDGWYGKMDARQQMRPAAHVFRLYNSVLVGPIVDAEVSVDHADVVPFAVAANAGPALSLVNKSEAPQRVRLALGEEARGPWQLHRVTASGLAEEPLAAAPEALLLPPLSVTVLSAARGAR